DEDGALGGQADGLQQADLGDRPGQGVQVAHVLARARADLDLGAEGHADARGAVLVVAHSVLPFDRALSFNARRSPPSGPFFGGAEAAASAPGPASASSQPLTSGSPAAARAAEARSLASGSVWSVAMFTSMFARPFPVALGDGAGIWDCRALWPSAERAH